MPLGPVSYASIALGRVGAAAGVIILGSIYHIPAVYRAISPWLGDTLSLDTIPPGVDPKEAAKNARKWLPHRGFYGILITLNAIGLALWSVSFGEHLIAAIHAQGADGSVRAAIVAGVTALIWAVVVMRMVARPPVIPPWSALIIYLVMFGTSIATFIDAAFERVAYHRWPEWTTPSTLILEGSTAALSLLLLLVIGSLRYNSPIVLASAPDLGIDDRVTFWQWMTFSWMNPLIAQWSEQQMEPEDLPRLSPTQQTIYLYDNFKHFSKSKLLRSILFANWFDVSIDWGLTVVSVILNYLAPYFLKQILDGLAQPTSKNLAYAYVYALCALLASVAKALSDLMHLWHSRRANLRIKSELIASIYHKALLRKDTAGVVTPKEKTDDKDKGKDKAKDNKKPKDGKGEKKGEKAETANTGKVVNLMSTDANMISSIFAMAYMLYSTPIEIIVACTFLYQLLGWSAFAGVVVLVVATPINSMLSKRAMAIQKDLLKARDQRISVMNELIGGISFIKFFAWTEKWKGRAVDARDSELHHMVRSVINSIFFNFLWVQVPIFVTLCAFFCYIVIAKQELTISVAFTAIALFNMLRMPLNSVPMFIMWFLRANVSIKRMEEFFGEDEVPDWVSSLKSHDDGPSGDTRIGFKMATLKWTSGTGDETPPASTEAAPEAVAETAIGGEGVADAEAEAEEVEVPFELTNLNIDFPLHQLSVVSGPTGAGKTAVLTALLGEMDLLEGETFLPKHPSELNAEGLRNSCAYAAQTPWLQQQSIKDNILFGEAFDEDRYEAVVDACALRTDFDILEDGDQTEIGAKGVSLSGGQKARVALARAVYSYTQHVLLDDPLAAVDSHTAKHLVDKCLKGPLLKGRTVILVSHHLDLLAPSADYIVRIVDGFVDCQGTPKELKASGELSSVVAIEGAEAQQSEPVGSDEPEAEDAKDIKKREKKAGPGRKLIKDEERAVGSVKWATYLLYFRAATYITWALFFVTLILQQIFSLLEKLWLKWWGENYHERLHSLFTFVTPQHMEHAHTNIANHYVFSSPNRPNISEPVFTIQGGIDEIKFPDANTHPGFYLAGYAIIMVGSGMLTLMTVAVGAWGSYRAAKTLHNRLLESVVHGTIRFFNTTPVGRIINRFSKDIETIDQRLNSSSRTVMTFAMSLLFTVGMIAWIIPQFLIPAAFISYLYYRYTVLYLRTGRNLRRLEATTRSPIFSGFAELLDGVISVRAFSAERRMFAKLCEQVDLSNSAFYYYWMTNRWLLFRFDCLGAAAVFVTTLLSLSGAVGVGFAAIAITSAQGFVTACYWLSRFWGELEMDLNSVERVEEYLHIPQEPPAVIAGSRPPATWPSYKLTGSFISAQDLEIKYAPDLPTVFKGSFDIQPGEKIGLIGRTGSGKSTIAMMMLRFTDPASGKLLIDGVDITSIGVDDLRSKITYIPQDAVLFSGTVRENLDPFGEHTDAELIETLRRVRLISPSTPTHSRAGSRAQSRVGSTTKLTQLAEGGNSAGDDAKDGLKVPRNKSISKLMREDKEQTAAGGSSTAGTATPSGRVQITLNTEVSAGGANFSQGQRQLVAMARALLRRSNLIIMDEATASVDFETDEALQSAIRTEFKEATLITIAHRLSSVIDYDRLLVLSDGSVAEFDTPMNLLRRDSIFKSMAENSGKWGELHRAAQRKEEAGRGAGPSKPPSEASTAVDAGGAGGSGSGSNAPSASHSAAGSDNDA